MVQLRAGGRPLVEVGYELARLRAAGLPADAQVRLVGEPGAPPSPGRRTLLLRAWGIGGTERLAGRTLVLGGAASGKSLLAEQLLAAEPQVSYVATGRPPTGEDPEWAARVAGHVRRRPAGWRTIETPDAAAALSAATGPVLFDAVGSWLTGVLDAAGAWTGTPGWQAVLDTRVGDLLAAWSALGGPLVAVSDEVGAGIVPATASGRLFRDLLGALNQRLAEASERVLLVVAGRVTDLSDG